MHGLHCGANCKVINALRCSHSHKMWTRTHCMQIANVMEFCFRISLRIYDLTRFSHFHKVDSQCFRWPLAAIVDIMEFISIQRFRMNAVRIAAIERMRLCHSIRLLMRAPSEINRFISRRVVQTPNSISLRLPAV